MTPVQDRAQDSAASPVRTIAYITATRAEYGLARRSLLLVDAADELDLKLIVTGDHLDPDHGSTLSEITADGIEVAAVLPVPPAQDGPLGTAIWIARCLPAFTATLLELRPDVLLVIGDRFEALAAAQAAALCAVPVAHVHGGEITSGSLDDAMRHAITKFACLHLTAAPEYARRIIQLGADPAFVRVVGAPGVDDLSADGLEAAPAILAELGLTPDAPFVLVTFHPATAVPLEQSVRGVRALVDALERMSGLQVVITGVNSDPGNSAIRAVLEDFALENPGRVAFVESLGHRRYLQMLGGAVACVGNSSSGLIEAPAAGTPTINIGPRQDGRLRAPSVTDVGEDVDAILTALRRARRFPAASADSVSVAARIVKELRDVDLPAAGAVTFHDCGPDCDSWTMAGLEPSDG